MKDKINNCTTLEELFELWKEAQVEESDESYNSYRYGKVDKTSFLPDGIIDEAAFSKVDKKVLFIAKEANWGGNNIDNEVNEKEDPFWLQGVVKKGWKKTNFSKGIAMLYNAYISNNFAETDEKHEPLINIAFMNLNKRGGYNYASFGTLYGYTSKYSEFIAKQIEIINPDIIICCSDTVAYLINTFIKAHITVPEIISVFHPSYFGVEKKAHLKRLECALNGEHFYKTQKSEKENKVAYKRGIIFDTYDEQLAEEMFYAGYPRIEAFGEAAKYINRLNIGDVVYYYHKGVGIIAAGEVVGELKGDDDSYYRHREVKLLVEPVKKDGAFIGVKVDSNFRNKVKNENGDKGFFLRKTTKAPYLYGDEIQKTVDIIREELKGE